MRMTLRNVMLVIPALALFVVTKHVAAQDYPSKPIRFIIPTAPSGGADVLGRVVGQKLSELLKQPVIFDNRAGAGGVIGSDLTVKSPADGYTILIVTSAHAINPSLYEKLPYDTLKDFAPIGVIGGVSYVISAHPSLPVKSLKELIAFAKSKPHQLNYGSAGNGSSNHMAMEYFKMVAGVDLVHVPYKGGAPATTGLLTGEVQVNFSSPPHVISHINTKRLTGLAVTSLQRMPALMSLPTIAESGFPGYRETGWYGLLAPANTPRPIIDRLNRELLKILLLPEIQSFFEKQGFEYSSEKSPEDFGALIKAEMEKAEKVVKKAGIKISK